MPFSKGGGIFCVKGMDEKELRFRLECRNYFHTVDLGTLRCYGRLLKLQSPTAKKKADLIEDILDVLCGKSTPYRNKRGAPVKNNFFDEKLLEKVAQLQKDYLFGGVEWTLPEEEREKEPAVLVEEMEEDSLEKLQITVRYSLLNEKQKKLFKDFFKSL